jgi:uncharacterized protein (DUF2267 family)
MVEAFITKIQGDLELQNPFHAELLAAAVLSTLRETIFSADAAAIERQLPKSIQAYWVGDMFKTAYRTHRREEIWREDQFFERVGRLAEIRDSKLTEDIVRVVFNRFQEILNDQDVDFFATKLPSGIRMLWVEGAPAVH